MTETKPLSSRGGTGRENVSVAAGAAPLDPAAEWRPAFKAARRLLDENELSNSDAQVVARTLLTLDYVLDDIKEYLEARHDIRDGENGPLPNEEMSLTSLLKEALGEEP